MTGIYYVINKKYKSNYNTHNNKNPKNVCWANACYAQFKLKFFQLPFANCIHYIIMRITHGLRCSLRIRLRRMRGGLYKHRMFTALIMRCVAVAAVAAVTADRTRLQRALHGRELS